MIRRERERGEKRVSHPESGQALLPRANARVPDEVQHLLVIVDVEALVRDGEREGDGRVRFGHCGGWALLQSIRGAQEIRRGGDDEVMSSRCVACLGEG